MDLSKDKILSAAADLSDEVIELRRHFHMHPELSYQEKETSSYIAGWLSKNGIKYKDGIAGTGIIATIDGKADGKQVIAIRAEMDALPIVEKNDTPYRSRNEGVMHACGHDAHMAMAMGTIKLLDKMKDSIGGKILFIFQPGEEKSPGGAKLVIASGVFNEVKPDIIIAQHILPELEVGKTGFKAGRYMASCDEIYITVSGRGGHAALPGLTTDQIYIASSLVVRLREKMNEKIKENNIPTVLGIGRISGEGATNVIPEKVFIAGTFRTFNEKWRAEGIEYIKKICSDAAAHFGVSISVDIAEGYPVLYNDEELTERAVNLSTELLGADRIETFETRMSSDDFSFYSAIAPSLYYRIGIKKKDGDIKKLHTAEFDLDENGLKTGVANLSWLICNLLKD